MWSGRPQCWAVEGISLQGGGHALGPVCVSVWVSDPEGPFTEPQCKAVRNVGVGWVVVDAEGTTGVLSLGWRRVDEGSYSEGPWGVVREALVPG